MVQTEKRANKKIRKGDTVAIITGREAQAKKTGKVLRIIRSTNRVVVEKVNMVKSHQKPNQQNRQGGIVEKEASMHLSNVVFVSRASDTKKEKKSKKDKE